MNYYESVVIDYLRADRALFVNTECCIQLEEGHNPDKTGPHWYCDAVVTDFRSKQIFLCEISYAKTAQGLSKRLAGWHTNWGRVRKALVRDSHLPEDWKVNPWLFVPASLAEELKIKTQKLVGDSLKFNYYITRLEDVQPWNYHSWCREEGTPAPGQPSGIMEKSKPANT